MGPVDELSGPSPGFGGLCAEFEESLNALGGTQRNVEGQRI
jgi:hypothetical protein